MTGDLREQLFGSLPPGWDVTRLKHVCSVTADYGANVPADEYTDDGMRFLRTTDINEDGTLDGSVDPVFVPSDLVEDSVLKSGDLLVSRSGTVGLSYLVNADLDGAAAYAGYLVRFRPARARDPRFLYYFTQSRPFTQQIDALSTQTTISNFSGRKYANMLVPVAPSEVEEDVADFLDEKTAGIDQLVEDKKRLIERLKEKRQALIDETVTGGRSDHTDRVETGEAWIGSVPNDWRRCRVKYLAEYINGYAFEPDDWSSEGRPIIRIQDLTGSSDDSNRYPGSLPDKYLVEPGDILIAWSASLGVHRWSGEPGWLNQHIYRVEPNRSVVEPSYFPWLADAFIRQMEQEIHGSTMQHITKEKFGSFVVYLPPLDEQQRLADFLEGECGRIRQQLEWNRKQIEKLEEYRTSLITAAVTGQIDVRASPPAVA